MNTLEEFLMALREDPSTGCWLWTKSVRSSGYGQVNWRGVRSAAAHRVAWELYCSKVPEGLWVLHKCDVRLCCNPSHLYLGTVVENSADMVARGRQARNRLPGERHPMAKLTAAQVAEIRRLYATGAFTQKRLGERFGVKQANVSLIVRGAHWKESAE